MLTPTYFTISDGDTRQPGECDRLQWLSATPMVGDRLPLGLNRLWKVVETHLYQGEDGSPLCVAYVALLGNEKTMPRAEWFDVRRLIKDPATCLRIYIKPDGEWYRSSNNFLGELPSVGHFLTEFDIETRKTSASTWWTTGYTTFTSADPSATFDRIHLARVEEYLETDDDASALEPQKTAIAV
jgi:hypothetical protein